MNTATVANIASQLAELAATREKAAALETSVNEARNQSLRELHTAYGYPSPADFVAAYRDANNGETATPVRHGSRKATRGANGNSNGKKNGQRKARVSITPEKGAEIIKFFKNDGSTIDAVNKFNISLATAQNWKDKAGMVNHRS
jgi:hypothetical protein